MKEAAVKSGGIGEKYMCEIQDIRLPGVQR